MFCSSSSSTVNHENNSGEDESSRSFVKKRKQELRSTVRRRLQALSEDDILEQSTRVWNKVLQLPAYQTARSIGIFLSMPQGEIRTEFLIQDATRQRKILFIPKVGPSFEQPDMDMLQVQQSSSSSSSLDPTAPQDEIFYTDWPRNKWGIPEPPANAQASMKIANPGDIDLLFVPGLAFDPSGHRLGQGKGYYDRFLQRMLSSSHRSHHTHTQYSSSSSSSSSMLLVAVGLSCQMVESVPTQSTDYTMDVVVLPHRLIVVN